MNKRPRRRWEYKYFKHESSWGSIDAKAYVEELNRYGQDGWEVAGTSMHPATHAMHVTLKREIAAREPTSPS